MTDADAPFDVPPDLEPGRLAIGVWMGGPSREREVSLASGRAVAEALEALGHDVRPADVRPEDVTPERVAGLDVVFLALHGTWGEDGSLQTLLDALGACYTGSGPGASRLAMDKTAAKERFGELGIPTPAFRVVEAGDDGPLAEAFETIGPDLVVKPVADGSSIDIAMVDTADGLTAAARAVWERGEPALVERRIPGREFTVGILGERPLPLIEIRTPGGWYDCEAAPARAGFRPAKPATWYDYQYKYTSDDTRYVFEHGLDADLADRMQEVSLAAHRALGCRDLSRVDLMLTPAGEPQVLEINTIPGFTSHSLVPKAAARAGLSFGRLCERIVALAWARRNAKGGPDANPSETPRAAWVRRPPGRDTPRPM
jgi:D-alanine-D-alanine ligase